MNKARLRVAVLGTRGIPGVMGGVESHCQALYPRLASKGIDVTLFGRSGYTGSSAPYIYDGVRVEPTWAPRRKNLEAILHTALGVIRAAFRREFDILHIHAIGPSLLVPFARMFGLKVVMTHHGPDYDRQKWGRLAKFMLRLGENLGCRFANAVITVSKHIKGDIKSSLGCEGCYIPNGVQIPNIIPPGDNLRRWGLKSGKYILAVGRFVPEKGFHDLLSAFSMIKTDWSLVIAGSADHETEYSRQLAIQASSDSRVVLTGFIKGDTLGEVYSNAGLFVIPSYHEGLPIALLESMSYNLPVIASDIPANREIVAPEDTFRAGDKSALKEKVEVFLDSPHAGVNNRGRVEEEYDWNSVACQTEEVYMKVCGIKPVA